MTAPAPGSQITWDYNSWALSPQLVQDGLYVPCRNLALLMPLQRSMVHQCNLHFHQWLLHDLIGLQKISATWMQQESSLKIPLWKLSSIGGTMVYTFLRRSFRVADAILIIMGYVVDRWCSTRIMFEEIWVLLEVGRSFDDQRFCSLSFESRAT
jgi:hypothetical protein